MLAHSITYGAAPGLYSVAEATAHLGVWQDAKAKAEESRPYALFGVSYVGTATAREAGFPR